MSSPSRDREYNATPTTIGTTAIVANDFEIRPGLDAVWQCNRGGDSVSVLKVLVDLERFELSTSSMPWKRAPNCATGPWFTFYVLRIPQRSTRTAVRFRAEKVLKVFVQKSIDSRAASGHNQTVGRDEVPA